MVRHVRGEHSLLLNRATSDSRFVLHVTISTRYTCRMVGGTGTTRDTLIRSLIICASFPFCVWDSCQFRPSNGARKTVITNGPLEISPRSSHNLSFFAECARRMKGVARNALFPAIKNADIQLWNVLTFGSVPTLMTNVRTCWISGSELQAESMCTCLVSWHAMKILFYVNALAQKKIAADARRILFFEIAISKSEQRRQNFLEEKRPASRRKCGKCIQKEFESRAIRFYNTRKYASINFTLVYHRQIFASCSNFTIHSDSPAVCWNSHSWNGCRFYSRSQESLQLLRSVTCRYDVQKAFKV